MDNLQNNKINIRKIATNQLTSRMNNNINVHQNINDISKNN
jgi:hypothetical protein